MFQKTMDVVGGMKMANKRRDDFSEGIKRVLAERVAYLCSNPDCGHLTVGPSSNEKEKINIGVAAHICAASPGGPRYDTEMTSKERSDIANGIWLCQTCSKLIDSDVKKYTVETLKAWKKNAEEEAIVRLNHGGIDLLSRREGRFRAFQNRPPGCDGPHPFQLTNEFFP